MPNRKRFDRSPGSSLTGGSLRDVVSYRALKALLVGVLVGALLVGGLVAGAETELEKAERLAAETQGAR